MSQQTQPQQKQPESLRRGTNTGGVNILSRATMPSNIAAQGVRAINDANDFEFYEANYEAKKKEKGCVYTWGSGEMGQLGYDIKVISKMPKDREGYPYQPQPFKIESLKDRIFQISGGDGHTVAIDINGKVYSWGASACGQLGLSYMKDLPTDIEGYPYQPTPRILELLSDVKIVQISCGDAHTVALSSEGKLYSWGGGGCGQLGHPDTHAMPKDEDGCPYQPKPKMISDLKNARVKQVACGKAHTVAVLESGKLYSWGAGACGQLGHPDTSSFPSDEDGYPFQPIPRLVLALKSQTLVYASCGDVHTMVLTKDGEIYCFGGGSCGQLGLGSISKLPLDVDQCPFMPVPQKIDTLSKEFIVKLSCGDSHSMALTKQGAVYAWGEATCGQLGFEDLKNLPRNADGRIYQPIPQKVTALEKKKIVEISCGEAHSLVLTDRGHVFGIGANSCGQLGQFYTEMKQTEAEEIFLAKPSDGAQSFCTYLETSSLHSNDNSGDSKGDDTETDMENKIEKCEVSANDEDSLPVTDTNSSNNNLEKMNIFEEKQKESVSLVPKLIKSLMHRKVLKISSGGVHNICVVEPSPNHCASDIYRQFMKSKFTDVCFVFKDKNFVLRDNVIEEDKSFESDDEVNPTGRQRNRLRKGYYEHKINAHKFMLAARSPVFKAMLKRSQAKTIVLDKKPDVVGGEQQPEIIQIKDCSFKAFKLMLDYIYLDNLNILDDIIGCNELVEILKLSKQYQLPDLLEKCEKQFLTLPSLQLFRNLITNSSQIGSFLKRGKEKPNEAGPRNYSDFMCRPYLDNDEGRSSSNSESHSHRTVEGPESLEAEHSFRRSTHSKRTAKQKNENLDGVMFLADGRILIVDNELYQEAMRKGIVIDLNENKARENFAFKPPQAALEEETKERIHSHYKAENPRTVTQSKTKVKKHSISTKKAQPLSDESGSDSQEKVKQIALGKELLSILNHKEFSDVAICIDGKEIYAHKAVLSSRSKYFEAMFCNDFKEAEKSKITLKGVGSYELFYNLIEFMYSDSLNINIRNVFDMLALAEEYGVIAFKEKAEIALSKYITITTVCLIFRYANEYNCQRLKETCLVYMEENYDEVIYSAGFEELDKDEMLLIIRLCKDKKNTKLSNYI